MAGFIYPSFFSCIVSHAVTKSIVGKGQLDVQELRLVVACICKSASLVFRDLENQLQIKCGGVEVLWTY